MTQSRAGLSTASCPVRQAPARKGRIKDMFFTLRDMTDTEFADYLAKAKALDNPCQVGKSVMWHGLDRACVAIAIYDNETLTRKIFVIT